MLMEGAAGVSSVWANTSSPGPPKGLLVPFLDYVITFSATFVCYWLCNWFWEWYWKATCVNQFSGPTALPIIGNGHQMMFSETGFYKWSWTMCRRWGDPMRLWRLFDPMIYISTYESAIDLLSKPNFLAKSQDIDLFWRQNGGNGLSSSPAHVNQSRRKLLQSGYSRQVVERSVPIFVEESKKLVQKLQPFAESGDVFNAVDFLMACSFHIICRAAFGDELVSKRSDQDALDHMRAFHKISINFTKRIMSPYLWLRNDFIYFNLTHEGRHTAKCVKVVNDFGAMAIFKRREVMRRDIERRNGENKGKLASPKHEDRQDLNHNATKPGASSYLDLVLHLCDTGELKDTDVLGELNNFIVAGYDTTALTVAWTLFALALHPSHQPKIHEEINQIFDATTPTNEVTLTLADTKEMKYLELCIKEALRLFPTSPVLPRSTTDSMELKDGRIIPAKTDVVIMVDMIHRDPKHFPNPDEFLPERHLKPIPSFIPFSTGPRNCIGQMFAMHHVKVELAYLLRDYFWETTDHPDTLPCLFQALLVPARGINFKITKRCEIK